jgi:hypothetical protein
MKHLWAEQRIDCSLEVSKPGCFAIPVNVKREPRNNMTDSGTADPSIITCNAEE